MANYFNYAGTTVALSQALRVGNYWIGVGEVKKGSTSVTGYWNGITPPRDGYSIYGDKGGQGPSIYVATNDANLIFLTNKIASQNFTTVTQCLEWFRTQDDKVVFNREYEPIVTDGLVLSLDAGFVASYPRNRDTWYDISGVKIQNNATLVDSLWKTNDSGLINFNGADNYIEWSSNSAITSFFELWWNLTSRSFEMWVNFSNLNFGVLFGVASVSDFESSSGYVIYNNKFGVQNAGGSIETTTGSDLSINTWYQVVFVRKTGGHQLYINGDPIEAIGTSFNVSDIQLGFDWQINMMRNGYGNYKEGLVSLFRLYSKELSASEVLQNYNAQKLRFPVYTHVAYPNCLDEVLIYSTSSSLTLGSRVYSDANLTIPFNNNSWDNAPWPGVFLPIGKQSDVNGTIISITENIGGCV